MDESYSEISFGRVIKDMEGKPTNKKTYAIYHWTFNGKRLFDPGFINTGISLEYLAGYLDGFLLTKQPNEFFLYNGISTASRNGYFPKCEFSPLNNLELEKLINGNKKLSKDIIRTI